MAFIGAERFGRKGSLMWGTWIMVVGTILQAAAYENVQMIISRIVSGIGNGINTCAVSQRQSLFTARTDIRTGPNVAGRVLSVS